jgi:hypothetical protein
MVEPHEVNTPDQEETYNPWSVVNLVFHHLASEGLHPILGESGDPGAPAAQLLRALGITPASEGNRHVSAQAKDDLARLREAFEAGQLSPGGTTPRNPRLRTRWHPPSHRARDPRGLSQVESTIRPPARCDRRHRDFREEGCR